MQTACVDWLHIRIFRVILPQIHYKKQISVHFVLLANGLLFCSEETILPISPPLLYAFLRFLLCVGPPPL